MREKRNIILTMLIAGALAGIAAAMMFLSGFMEWDINQSSVPAMGFNGIAAAFLGGLNPIGAIFSSYFIQHITDGGSSLDTRLYPTQISDLISSLIIYLCGFVLFFKLRMNARIDGKTKNKRPRPNRQRWEQKQRRNKTDDAFDSIHTRFFVRFAACRTRRLLFGTLGHYQHRA